MTTNEIKLSEIAQYIQAKLYGDGDIIITQISSINQAQNRHITFLKDHNLRSRLRFCKASAIILSERHLVFCPSTITALVVQDPFLAYAKIAQLLDTTPKLNPKITSESVIASDIILGKRIGIGSNVVIESGVTLDDDVKIGSGTVIGKNTHIGKGTYLFANVTIYHNIEIGSYCMIQSGSVIGSDGFGYVKNDNVWMKIPQLGRVIIGNHVEIGSCTTIDRGALDDTQIKNGVIIDNHCQIAHNVIIEQYTAIAGGVIIAGSVEIGKYCMIGGASVINGHISICDNVIITGMSMVIKSIKIPGTYSSGIPIQPNSIWKRTAVLVMRIGHMNQRIKIIEQNLNNNYHYYYIKIVVIIYCFILLGLTGFIMLIRFF